jgi:cytochrome P450
LTNNDFRYTIPDWSWKLSYQESFQKHQGILVLATPGYVHIFMADAEAIQQVTSRREAFPKLLKDYKNLDIFGRSVVSTEGADWKEHRRVLAPAFNEKNNALVFAESANQARIMISRWLALGDATINEVPVDTMRAALHMISRIGFGVNLQWPGEEQHENQGTKKTTHGSKSQENRTMSFQDALGGFLENFFLAVLTPKWLLSKQHEKN